jgi:hypothetical protein
MYGFWNGFDGKTNDNYMQDFITSTQVIKGIVYWNIKAFFQLLMKLKMIHMSLKSVIKENHICKSIATIIHANFQDMFDHRHIYWRVREILEMCLILLSAVFTT